MSAPHLRVYRVLDVDELACLVWADGKAVSVRFSATFPSPRVERVAPGHLVAVAAGRNTPVVVVWRWYDAVVLGSTDDGAVRLWEPAHGEVVARARSTYVTQEPGSRAFASAGLPGAAWWVTGICGQQPSAASVDLEELVAFYNDNDLWATAFDLPSSGECR